MDSNLNVVDSFKYLRHFIATVSNDIDDIDDISNKMSLFYARANVLLYVDLVNVTYLSNYVCKSLLYSILWQFYGMALWQKYYITVLKRLKYVN